MFLILDPECSPYPVIVRPELIFWKDGFLFLHTSDVSFEFPCTFAQFESMRCSIGFGVYDLRYLGPALSDVSEV